MFRFDQHNVLVRRFSNLVLIRLVGLYLDLYIPLIITINLAKMQVSTVCETWQTVIFQYLQINFFRTMSFGSEDARQAFSQQLESLRAKNRTKDKHMSFAVVSEITNKQTN